MRTEASVSRDELERVAREYHRLREDHHRAPAGSRARRRLGSRLDRLQARFERLLGQAGADEVERARWYDHLWHGSAEPGAPAAVPPLLFHGRSADRRELLLLAQPTGEVAAIVDGRLATRLEADAELARTAPGMTFELDGAVYAETFSTPPELRAELRAALEAGEPPPARLVEGLLADGLLDRELGLTPRGRRALRLDADPARHGVVGGATLNVSTRGPVPEPARARLETVLEEAARIAPRPPLHLRGTLARAQDPALERPALAKAVVDMGSRIVRAHVVAPTELEAVDLVEARLRERLRALGSRDAALRHEGGEAEPGEWRRANLPSPRRPYFPRPPEERELVRRKTHAAEPMTPEEATFELRLLDHDFHLFTDLASGEPGLVYLDPTGTVRLKRRSGDGGGVDLVEIDPDPAPTLTFAAAVARLDATNEPFLFFVDDETGRGSVLYRRYDGHYGLVTAR